MEANEISDYINNIKKSLSTKVPEDKIEVIMVDISNYFFSNWVDNPEFLLDDLDIENLIRKNIND